jgi:hypothetical protein
MQILKGAFICHLKIITPLLPPAILFCNSRNSYLDLHYIDEPTKFLLIILDLRVTRMKCLQSRTEGWERGVVVIFCVAGAAYFLKLLSNILTIIC